MIHKETKLSVADNSGAILVKCIRIISSKNHKIGSVGSLLLVRIIKKNHSKKVKNKVLYYGLVIMVKQYLKRKDGTIMKFNDNRLLLFSNSYKFLGSRIYGPLMKEVHYHLSSNKKEKQKYLKVISYANSIL